MLYRKLITSRSLFHRVNISWSKIKTSLIQSADGFSSIEQPETDNCVSPNSSHLYLDKSKDTVPIDQPNDPDIYTQNKNKTRSTITQLVIEKSFEKEEEKYQNKLSQIIEIFYSLDESSRPKEMKAFDIDYMVKMRKPKQIKNYLKNRAAMEARHKCQVEFKQELKEKILYTPRRDFGIVFDEETGAPVYKFHNVCQICSWSMSKRIRELQYARIAQAKILDSPKIIFDFDYDQYMTVKQHITITAQVNISMGILRELTEPVNLYFCNLKPESPVAQYLELDFGQLSSHMVEVTSNSYLDLFPKERLVYLTADTENVLKYDPDDIYIIGGMIDTLTNEPVSAIKAQREGLRTAKLPLNDYVKIRNEVKSLKISQVFGIICHLASSNNENLMEALEKFIPFRIQPDHETDSLITKHEKDWDKSREMLKNKFALTDEETEVMLLLAVYHTLSKR